MQSAAFDCYDSGEVTVGILTVHAGSCLYMLDFNKARYNLGMMYIRGDGVDKNMRKGIAWLARSAHQGNPLALEQLKLLLQRSGGDIASRS